MLFRRRNNGRLFVVSRLCFLLCLCVCTDAKALSLYATDTVSSSFFRDFYLSSSLTYYLDNLNDYTVGLGETTGGWDGVDRMLFSVQGNSPMWNKYYVRGFRVNSVFDAGSTVFRPNMSSHSLRLNTERSAFFFEPDSASGDYVMVRANAGGIGGAAVTSRYLINLFHPSALERLAYETELSHPEDGSVSPLDPRTARQHIIGAGEIEGQYSFAWKDGRLYRQHIYADFGWRSLPELSERGIEGMFTEPYWKVQADGEIPFVNIGQKRAGNKRKDVSMFYMLSLYSRGAYGMESGLNKAEAPKNDNYSAALYWTGHDSRTQWTAGAMWETNKTRHTDLSFARNIVDQDGEAFSPWMPDGLTHALTLSATLRHQLTPWLSLCFDGANSVVMFSPERENFSNRLYWRSMYGSEKYDLGRIDWRTHAFAAGLADNTLSLHAEWKPVAWFGFHASFDAAFDAVLLGGGKSILRANGQAAVALNFKPCSFFEISLDVGDYRAPFNMETVRFFSDDYLSGTIYNNDGSYSSMTGGAAHKALKDMWQPRYFVLDIPFAFTFGRHEIAVISSYRKYYAQWTVEKSGELYEVTPLRSMGSNVLNNTPYLASNLVRYTYSGKRLFFSLSWQSYMMTAAPAMASGVLSNDVGVLSEWQAVPANWIVSHNTSGTYPFVGRANQDKAYIARIAAGWNITDNWQLAATFKFKDGQPFSNYDYAFSTDEAGNTQVTIWNARSRGINPTDGDFGSRKDAFFNLDASLRYRALFRNGQTLTAKLTGYNLYDFATELTEYTFEENGGQHRYAMTLCIPRGLMIELKYEF